jgi:lysophospholipase L1-like esterase
MRKYLNRISPPIRMLLAAFALLLLLLMPVLLPIPGNISANVNDGTISLSVDDRVLWKPGACVQVSWRVSGVQSVYVDGSGTIGVADKTQCTTSGYTPTLRADWPDGSSTTHELPLTYVLLSPLSWGVIALASFLLIAGLTGLLRRLLGPHLRILQRPTRAFVTVAVLLLLTVLLLETATRWYFASYGTPAEQIRYIVSADDLQRRAELNNLLHPVPLINYLPELGQINALGYRGDLVQIPKPDSVFRVVALGGSTTYGTGTSAAESYPAHLQRILRDEYGYTNVEIVNAGVPSWNTWHSLSNLAFRVLELEPDMIVIFHAINDVFPRVMAEGCYAGITPYRGLPTNIGFYNPQGVDFGPSALYRFVAVNLGWMPDPAGQASGVEVQFEQSLCPYERTNDIDVLEANEPIYYERNLRSMVGIAQAHNVAVMLASWTYYELRDFEVRGVDQHNAISAALAEELGLPYYDLRADFPRDRSLWAEDLQHMNGAGSRIQAELFAAFMHDNALLP